MNKIYQRIDWENYPSSATPLNEDNLNKMDYAIDKLDDRIVTHETTKLDIATGNNLVKNVTFTERTGVFTIEKLNGSKFTINTALEKISINFYFNPTTQKLALTLIDGTVQEIDLSALITQYEFLESDTITFEIDASGKVKANILNGSITGEKLEPNYLANVTLQANNAKTSADNAKTSEELAYQYAEEAKESASQTAKSDAKNITYDNTESGLSATNVKDALDEVAQGSVSAIATDTTITDSTNAPLVRLKVKGKTEQFTTSGKNKLKVEDTNNHWQCTVTVDGDGKATLTNTATSGVVYARLGSFSFEANKTYTISVKNAVNLKHYTFFKKGTAESANITYTSGNVTVKPTANVDTDLVVYMNDISTTGKTTSLYIQIEEGSTASPYEPFTNGASPNPDYPQEINGLAKDGAIEVKTCGKNIFGATLEDYQQKGAISGSGTELYFKLKPNTKYTCSSNAPVFDSDGNTSIWFNGGSSSANGVNDGNPKTTTTDNNGMLRIVLRTSNLENIFANYWIQVEEGETPTDYESPKETTANIPTGAPLYEGDYLEVYADGSGKLYRKMKEVVFDGSDDELWAVNGVIFQSRKILNASIPIWSNTNKQKSSHFNVGQPYGDGDDCFSINNNNMLSIRYNSVTTLEDFNTWLQSNPVTVVYELAKPTETPLTAEQVAQFKKLCTFEPVTNVLCDGEVEMRYYKANVNGETVGMLQNIANNSVSKSSIANNLTTTTEGMVLDATQGKALNDKISTLNYSLENRLSKSLVSTETINIDNLSLSSGGYSTMTSDEISKSGYTLVGANFFLRGSYAENIIASFTIGGSSTKIYNFAFYNPSDYDISAYGYVDLIYVANSL